MPRLRQLDLRQGLDKGRRWTEFAKRSSRSCRTCPARLSILRRPQPSSNWVSTRSCSARSRNRFSAVSSVKIAFRQLLGDLSTIPALERFIRRGGAGRR